SKRWNETDARPTLPVEATLLCFLTGQLCPLHVIVIRAPGEARIERTLSLMPEEPRRVTMRTRGNGRMSADCWELTGIVWLATLDAPVASVTRSRTTWLPGVANEVLCSAPPAWNDPLPARSQAKAVSGLAASVEPETSETRSPTCGTGGYHENDAAGPAAPGAIAAAAPATWN